MSVKLVDFHLDIHCLLAGAFPCTIVPRDDVFDLIDSSNVDADALAYLRNVLNDPVVVPGKDVAEVAPSGVDEAGPSGKACVAVSPFIVNESSCYG